MNPEKVLGNKSLTKFDVLIIGSGAGGSAAAEILTRHGQKVLILEAGSNYFVGLDDPNSKNLSTLFSNDETKMRRNFISPDPLVEPRTFRKSPKDGLRKFTGDVNSLPKTVGGGATHADLKMVRFMPFDFEMGRYFGSLPGASFANWPISYDELEKFYLYTERLMGVQGTAGSTPFDPPRSAPFPMAPGVQMLVGLLASQGARKLGYHPFPYPASVNSAPYDGRPACIDCGFCSGYGCPNSSKGSPAVTALRRALLTGNALLVTETRATKLNRSGDKISGVEVIDADGKKQIFYADRYILAASPIESTRLLLLSDPSGTGLGNASGLVGRNLMFHYQTYAIGIFKRRLHGHRGRAVSTGLLDFRGDPRKGNQPLGGIVEFAGGVSPVEEATDYSKSIGITGGLLKKLMKQSPMRDRLMAFIMQGEDAPQASNFVDLDPQVKDLDGLPVARVTYANHSFELNARKYYSPKLIELLGASGAKYAFTAPADSIPASRHIMGTLRFGTDPKNSVCDRAGKFHDLENLFVADGSLFPTSSGINPTLTICALASRVAGEMIFPGSPERALL